MTGKAFIIFPGFPGAVGTLCGAPLAPSGLEHYQMSVYYIVTFIYLDTVQGGCIYIPY